MTTLLFDLDGTLIDSAPQILGTFSQVLARHGVPPAEPVDRRVIGPPLLVTLQRLSGVTDPERLEAMAADFRAGYDGAGVAATEGYAGLLEVLDTLQRDGHRSLIVTNKRILPARAICDRLGMSPFLDAIYAPDAFTPKAADKADVTGRVLAAHALHPARCVFVGDSTEDATAAARHGIPFLAAAYGYGDAATQREAPVAAVLPALTDLPAVLRSLASTS